MGETLNNLVFITAFIARCSSAAKALAFAESLEESARLIRGQLSTLPNDFSPVVPGRLTAEDP